MCPKMRILLLFTMEFLGVCVAVFQPCVPCPQKTYKVSSESQKRVQFYGPLDEVPPDVVLVEKKKKRKGKRNNLE